MDESALKEVFLSKEPIWRGNIINVEKWLVQLPNGETASRDIVKHNGAAAIVAVDDQQRVAMVSQYRCAIGRITLELPAGKLDSKEEDPFTCAKRELEEETGLIASSWHKLTDMVTTPGFCDEVISIYLATELSQHESHTDEDEFLSVSFIPLAQLIQMVMAGEISDGKTALGLMLAKETLTNK